MRPLMLSMMLMMLMTLAMLAALLPDYAAIGPAACGLLLLLRCFMAFSVGGEYTGVVAYLPETRPGLAGMGTAAVRRARFTAPGHAAADCLHSGLRATMTWLIGMNWSSCCLSCCPCGISSSARQAALQ